MKKGDMMILLWRIPLDFAVTVGAWFLAYFIRPYTDLIPGVQRVFASEQLPLLDFFLPFVLISAAVLVLLFALLGRYRFAPYFEPIREFFGLLFGIFLWGMLIVAWYALWRHELIFSRIVLLHTMLFALGGGFLLRLALRGVQMLLWYAGYNQQRIILFGSPERTETIKKELLSDPQFALVRTCTVQDFEMLENMRKEADELWRCDPKVGESTEKRLQKICAEKHLLYRFVPHKDIPSFAGFELDFIAGTPLIQILPSTFSAWQKVAKRGGDIIGSLCILFVLSPVLLAFSIAIKIDSSGPVFYTSQRVGRQGKLFRMWKFRSMIANAEQKKRYLWRHSHRDGPFFKVKNDPRVTCFGRFLRRFSLDELPNFFNVLKGDMSLVGPRAHLPEEVKAYAEEYKRILMIKPGVTGLAQISGRSDLKFADEMRLDLYYLRNWSFWLDIKVVWQTVAVIFAKEGAD